MTTLEGAYNGIVRDMAEAVFFNTPRTGDSYEIPGVYCTKLAGLVLTVLNAGVTPDQYGCTVLTTDPPSTEYYRISSE